MINSIIEQWDLNNHNLKQYFESTEQREYCDYKEILSLIFELVVEKVDKDGVSFTIQKENIRTIDDGEYEGTLIYIIPIDRPFIDVSDYLITDNYYGSCSGCDALLSISDCESKKPNEIQVKEYMTIALHLVQKLRWMSKQAL